MRSVPQRGFSRDIRAIRSRTSALKRGRPPQERAFQPTAPTQWIAWVLIGAGWLLATALAAGITRVLSRQ